MIEQRYLKSVKYAKNAAADAEREKFLAVVELFRLRRETAQRGLDPNLWFNNVERVASERIGRETVTYVSNIYKYYLTYRLLDAQRERREAAKMEVGKRK